MTKYLDSKHLTKRNSCVFFSLENRIFKATFTKGLGRKQLMTKSYYTDSTDCCDSTRTTVYVLQKYRWQQILRWQQRQTGNKL